MKILLIILLSLSSSFAQYCFKDKSADKIICYEKYFKRENIYKAKSDDNYFMAKNGRLYAISDKIEIKFNSIGAIISLEKNFEIDFYDKLKNDTYIFKVRNPHELFSILSNLNELDAIQKAVPQKIRKYTQIEIERRIEARKARLEKVMKRTKMNKKDGKKIGFQTEFTTLEEDEEKGGKNFLRGEH